MEIEITETYVRQSFSFQCDLLFFVLFFLVAIQVKRFREKIEATGHLEGCHWIANPSPESFCHLPSSTSEMECVFTENLKTFNVAMNHTFSLPCLTKECRDGLVTSFFYVF